MSPGRVLAALLLAALMPLLAAELLFAAPGAWPALQSLDRSTSHIALLAEARLRTLEEDPHDVLIVGSSVARHAVQKGLLERRLDATVAQVQVNRLSPLELVMLGELVVSARPRIVLYVLTQQELTQEPRWSSLRFYDPRVAWELAGAEVFRDRDAHLRGLAEWRFGLLRHRRPLAEAVAEMFGVPLAAVWTDVEEHPEPASADMDPAGVHVRALVSLAGKLADAGIELVVIAAPLRDAPPHGADTLDTVATQARFLYRGPDWVGPYVPDDFIDSVHLGEDKRRALTRRLVGLLNPLLADDAL